MMMILIMMRMIKVPLIFMSLEGYYTKLDLGLKPGNFGFLDPIQTNRWLCCQA